jgi:hypothetical protein
MEKGEDKWVHIEHRKWDSPISVSISKWKLNPDCNRVFYNINIAVRRNGDSDDRRWDVWKPYKEFLELKRSLGLKINMKFKSKFPKKIYLRQQMTPSEIEIRKHLLETWLCELCHSEEFVYVSHRIVLSKLNAFFAANQHGGDITIKHTTGCLNEIAMRPSMFNNPFNFSSKSPAIPPSNSEPADTSSMEQSSHNIARQSLYQDIITQINGNPPAAPVTPVEIPNKKRYFFHRLLLPLVTPASAEQSDKPLFPISMDYLMEQLPCKVDLMSVLNTIPGGFVPESCATAFDETDHQLEKDYGRDRVVIQDVKINGANLDLTQLMLLISLLAKQAVFNTYIVDCSDDVAYDEDGYYDRLSEVSVSTRSECCSVASMDECASNGSYMELSPSRTGSMDYVNINTTLANKSHNNGKAMLSPISTVPRLNHNNLCGLEEVFNIRKFIDFNQISAMNNYMMEKGFEDRMLQEFLREVLFTASRTNSAYHAHTALQIMLGILPSLQPAEEPEGAKMTASYSFSQFFQNITLALPPLTTSAQPEEYSIGEGIQEEDSQDPGSIIVSAESSLARPIYIHFTYKPLPSKQNPKEIIWCLVCDIKSATVYKFINSNAIEHVLLQLKATYYKQIILYPTASQSPKRNTPPGDGFIITSDELLPEVRVETPEIPKNNRNEGAWLFLDKDIKPINQSKWTPDI